MNSKNHNILHKMKFVLVDKSELYVPKNNDETVGKMIS